MANEIQGPDAVAAANKVRRKRDALVTALVARVRNAMSGYTGETCTHIRLTDAEATVVDELPKHLPGWSFYPSAGGRLYMGTAALVEAQKAADGVVTLAPVTVPVEKVVAPVVPVELVDSSTAPVVDLPLELVDSGINTPVAAVVPVNVVADNQPVTPVVAETSAAPSVTKFAVNAVQPNDERRELRPARDVLQKLIGQEIEACCIGGGDQLVRPLGFHALMEAAHVAFSSHYGLVLSPDVVWVTIAQGFAKLVNAKPEQFRDRFVTHQGKATIKIRRDQFVKGDPNNDWAGCYDEFAEEIGKHVGTDTQRQLVSDFTTTGALERAVSNVVLMDTVQSYFVYVVETRCGIPFIKLTGSVADWQKVLDKARGLATFGDLKFWLDDLIPILEQFVKAAAGQVDKEFWTSIYKSKSASGSLNVTGWLVKLLPMTKGYAPGDWRNKIDVVNPLLGKKQTPHLREAGGGQLLAWYDDDDYRVEMDEESCGVVTTDLLPSSLSTVPFIWDYLGTQFDYKFAAGVVGYTQDKDDLSLVPQFGWAVLPGDARKVRHQY